MGVVASDPHGWRHGRVEVTAARTLLDNRRLMRVLGERGIEVPVVTPAGLPLNPDTEFEARYTQHVAGFLRQDLDAVTAGLTLEWELRPSRRKRKPSKRSRDP